ncbi:MAG TPA: DUF5916 domain-containing protein [Gemmatimonadaceae bacterium]
MKSIAGLFGFGFVLVFSAEAQTAPDSGSTAVRPALKVARFESRVPFDGRITDALWSAADSISDFRQREPIEGRLPTERTVVKVARDRDALYVAVRAFDSFPSGLCAGQLRRDADLTSDDNVTVLIDSYQDRRSAFLFQTNPNGAMWDAQLAGVNDLNSDWNGIWDVVTTRDSLGWTAEFRIPFSTLRFASTNSGVFGFNVRRFICRKNEEILWRGWLRTEGLHQLLAEGDLTELGVLERSRDLEIKPYALLRGVEPQFGNDGRKIGAGSISGKFGLDAKAAIASTLTADLTIDTDFAQAEVDQQVVNLTRFPTFFPEKRDFFLESSGVFDFGTLGQTQTFYSRRIGLVNGVPVPILAGARMTGRAGPWTLGTLDARTGGSDNANDAVVRLKHDFLDRGYLGGVATFRSGPGVRSSEEDIGLDANLPLVIGAQNLIPSGWIDQNRSIEQGKSTRAWQLQADYPNDRFDSFASLSRIDSGFQPALGFVRRAGIWETQGQAYYTPRPGILGIRQLQLAPVIPNWDIIAGHDGSVSNPKTWQTASMAWQPFGATFNTGDQLSISIQRKMDAPPEAFPVFRSFTLRSGRYWWTRGELGYVSSFSRPTTVAFFVNSGTFYSGRSTDMELSGVWRGGGHVILGGETTRSAVSLPGEKFTVIEAHARLEYSFTTRTGLMVFSQFDNEARRADFNIRYHWIPRIGADVYVVWNSGYTTDPGSQWRFPSARALDKPLNGALVIKTVWRGVF